VKIVFIILSLMLISHNSSAQPSDLPLLENRSNLSFSETVEQIKSSAENMGWKVPAVHNLQNSLSMSGHEVLPVNIVELCKPEFAAAILKENSQRSLSAFMPCRIAVYENEKGEVFVSRLDMNKLSANGEMNKVLQDAADEMELMLSGIL
jgi:uncharacterized protein (DUF302 family)